MWILIWFAFPIGGIRNVLQINRNQAKHRLYDIIEPQQIVKPVVNVEFIQINWIDW